MPRLNASDLDYLKAFFIHQAVFDTNGQRPNAGAVLRLVLQIIVDGVCTTFLDQNIAAGADLRHP